MEGNYGMSYVNKDCDVTMLERERGGATRTICRERGGATLEEREWRGDTRSGEATLEKRERRGEV